MSETKTGKQRYRLHKTCFGKPLLVLQIEVKRSDFVSYGPTVECETYTMWRDASLEDLSEIECNKENIE